MEVGYMEKESWWIAKIKFQLVKEYDWLISGYCQLRNKYWAKKVGRCSTKCGKAERADRFIYQ